MDWSIKKALTIWFVASIVLCFTIGIVYTILLTLGMVGLFIALK